MEKGKENLKKPTGNRNKMTLSDSDKVNTRQQLAEELDWSTGKVAKAGTSRDTVYKVEKINKKYKPIHTISYMNKTLAKIIKGIAWFFSITAIILLLYAIWRVVG